MTDALITVRAIHFSATVIAAGIIFFECLIAEPAWRRPGQPPLRTANLFRSDMAWLLWISLAVALASGAAWLALLAARIVDRPMAEVIADGTAWIVLTQTRFGFDWQLRTLFAVLFAGSPLLLHRTSGRHLIWRGAVAALPAIGFLGALAWAGHGGATPGEQGNLHLAADFVHLIAAGAWLGGLVPLVLLLRELRRSDEGGAVIACDVTRRFSNLGLVAVGALIASGAINVWFLLGGLSGLSETSYGQLLLVKLALFLAMLCLAAVNRLRLLPHLSDEGTRGHPDQRTMQALQRNATAEIVLGVGVVIIVAMLGITPPPAELHLHLH